MALTDKKRRYVAARLSGLSGAKAAIAAGYSEKGAAQAAARLNKDPDVVAALQRAGKVNNDVNQPVGGSANESEDVLASDLDGLGFVSDPKTFLLAVMNSKSEDMKLRADVAKALLPFEHARVGEQGKKEAKNVAAKKAVNRFAPSAPPLRMVKGGG